MRCGTKNKHFYWNETGKQSFEPGKTKNISLGVESDHYKQKVYIWQKQTVWGQHGGLKPWKPVRTKYLNIEAVQFPETPGFAERKRKQENKTVNQNHSIV